MEVNWEWKFSMFIFILQLLLLASLWVLERVDFLYIWDNTIDYIFEIQRNSQFECVICKVVLRCEVRVFEHESLAQLHWPRHIYM